jgi:hypothetical protein
MIDFKRLFITGLLIAFFSGSLMPLTAAEKINYKKGDKLYVLSDAGLVIRSAADKNASKVSLAPYGKQVTVKENNPGDKPFEVSGIKGYWVNVVYEGKEGYAFDGFLSLHPVPDRCQKDCDNHKIIELYADKKLKLKGKAEKKEDDSFIYVKKSYTNGFTIDRKEGQPGLPAFEMTFTMQDMRIAEAFMILKVMGFTQLNGRAFPVKDSSGTIEMLKLKWNDKVEVKQAKGDIVNIKIYNESVDEMGVGMETMSIEFSATGNSVVVKYSSGGS